MRMVHLMMMMRMIQIISKLIHQLKIYYYCKYNKTVIFIYIYNIILVLYVIILFLNMYLFHFLYQYIFMHYFRVPLSSNYNYCTYWYCFYVSFCGNYNYININGCFSIVSFLFIMFPNVKLILLMIDWIKKKSIFEILILIQEYLIYFRISKYFPCFLNYCT